MNRIYKVIWNKVRNCYVVTSEITKNHGKNAVKSVAHGTKPGIILAVLVLGITMVPAISVLASSTSTVSADSATSSGLVSEVADSGIVGTVQQTQNTATGNYATVTGGIGNNATGRGASISGGGGYVEENRNTASGILSSISGGRANTASREWATISGGSGNTASGSITTVSGGAQNTAAGMLASIFGGVSNMASGNSTAILGGSENSATQANATVSGGRGNTAAGDSAAITGGYQNTAAGEYSFAAGGRENEVKGDYAMAMGGSTNKARGNYSAVIGGYYNQAAGPSSFVGGGMANKAGGSFSFIGGGGYNQALADGSTALGGMEGILQGEFSTGIGGGSTGEEAYNAVAIGAGSAVTVENGLALGNGAVTDEEGTIAFGHDKGDTYYEASYDETGEVTAATYEEASYNRLVKVADGIDDHDVATVGQVKAKADAAAVTALEQKSKSLTRETNSSGEMETALTESASAVDSEAGKTNAFQSKVGVSGTSTSIETSKTRTDTVTGEKVTHESYGTYGSDIIYQGTQSWDESKNKGTLSSLQIGGNGTLFDLNQYGEGGHLVSSTSTRIAGDKITVSDDKGNASWLSTDGLTAGGRNYDAAQAALMADGRIKGANGNFEVGTDGSMKAAGGNFMVDTSGKASAKGVDAGGEKVTNVAAGDISAQSTDAVNGGQLYSMNNGLRSSIHKLDSRINKVGAGAAALAALHPQDFDPADKWNFAAGYGNYRDANAMALGAFYRPNASTMLSVGGSMGNGENMMNVGFSFKFGQSSPYAGLSRQSLIQQLEAQNTKIAAQDTQIAELKKQNEEMQQQIAEILTKLK